jgi:hypothetical protein
VSDEGKSATDGRQQRTETKEEYTNDERGREKKPLRRGENAREGLERREEAAPEKRRKCLRRSLREGKRSLKKEERPRGP